MNSKIKGMIGVLFIFLCINLNAQTTLGQISDENSINSQKESILLGFGMKKDILEDRVRSKVLLDIDAKTSVLISDGIEAVEATKMAIVAIAEDDKDAAIDYIGEALGKLETVVLRNPNMLEVPVTRVIRTDDLDTDLGAIHLVKESISKALEQNKFHLARQELKSLLSEVRIETTNIPIGNYPSTLKRALLLIENNDLGAASSILSSQLNTLVVSEKHISLPCMRAEVLLEEALTIQPRHLDPIANRKLLLTNAKNQINIAFELGQIEKASSRKILNQIEHSLSVIGTSSFKDELKNTIASIEEAKNEYDDSDAMNL